MPLPEETDAENILIKIEGNSTDITLSWVLVPTLQCAATVETVGEEVEVNIATTGTIWQQRQFLYEMTPKHIDEKFDIFLDPIGVLPNTFEAACEDLKDVVVENDDDLVQFQGTWQKLDFNITGGSPANMSVSLQFIVGNVISAYSSDAPNAPRNFKATLLPSNNLKLEWETPTAFGGSSLPVTKYLVSVLKIGGGIAEYDTETAVTDYTIPAAELPNGIPQLNDSFAVAVRAVNSQGAKGEKSPTRRVKKV